MPRKRVNRKTSKRRQTKRTLEYYARKNRNNPTRSELKLWARLKLEMKMWGVEFVFQGVLLNKYIGDFVCYEKKLVVEVDGKIHDVKRVKEKDIQRTLELNSAGYRVIRFSNFCVNNYTGMVLNTIKREIRE